MTGRRKVELVIVALFFANLAVFGAKAMWTA